MLRPCANVPAAFPCGVLADAFSKRSSKAASAAVLPAAAPSGAYAHSTRVCAKCRVCWWTQQLRRLCACKHSYCASCVPVEAAAVLVVHLSALGQGDAHKLPA